MFTPKTSAIVEKLLKENPATRNDDILLILKVWEAEGFMLTFDQKERFRQVSKPETIRRTRQKIQEERYRPTAEVDNARQNLARSTRSTIARERIAPMDAPLTQGKCPTCGAGFISEQHLITHIKKNHK